MVEKFRIRASGHLTLKLIQLGVLLAQLIFRTRGGRARINRDSEGGSVVGIEAGERAWPHIEFEELHQSAIEYFGHENVAQLRVSCRKSYLREVRDFLAENNLSHYVYDPRTGNQGIVRGLFDAFSIGLLLSQKEVTPIVYCTDISVRLDRAKASIVTALNGVTVCFMDRFFAAKIFPHERLIGPLPMPVSQKTLDLLADRTKRLQRQEIPVVSFIGSLYEPRISYFEEIKLSLRGFGVDFRYRGRQAGGERITNDDYWNILCSSDVVVTTSDQGGGRGVDLVDVNQMVFRLSEGMASGSCVVMERAPGVEKFFVEGVHYVGWSQPSEAVEKIRGLLDDRSLLFSISSAGSEAVRKLAEEKFFWSSLLAATESSDSPELKPPIQGSLEYMSRQRISIWPFTGVFLG